VVAVESAKSPARERSAWPASWPTTPSACVRRRGRRERLDHLRITRPSATFAGFTASARSDGSLVITNAQGDFILLTRDEFKAFVEGTIARGTELYERLKRPQLPPRRVRRPGGGRAAASAQALSCTTAPTST
jgi:hypothetical protein